MRAALTSAAFFFLLVLAGCAGPDGFGGSRQAVEDWSRPQGFTATQAGNPELPLLALVRGDVSEILHVYIEGDGAAWLSPYHPPRDPTPAKPIALALAAQDPAVAVAYLGRPCQYLDAASLSACPVDYWTSHRFAPEVVESYQQALDALKAHHGSHRLRLFGYSGGGTLAMLLGQGRGDVDRIVTVAAPVSVAEWAAWHRVSPLRGSLDPATIVGRFPPTIHFVGMRDDIVPAGVVEPFAARSGGRLIRAPEFDHECCWSRDWRRLLEEIR